MGTSSKLSLARPNHSLTSLASLAQGTLMWWLKAWWLGRCLTKSSPQIRPSGVPLLLGILTTALIVISFGTSAWGDSTSEPTSDSPFFKPKALGAALIFSPLDLIVPKKLGLGGSFRDLDAHLEYDLEYLSARFVPFFVSDLGAFSEQRLSLVRRSFGTRSSFYYHWGVSHLTTRLEFGRELLKRVVTGYPHLLAFETQSLGLQLGMGNQWLISNDRFSFRIDWFSLTQPLYTLKRDIPVLAYLQDQDSERLVEGAVALSQWMTRLTFLKLQVTYLF